jgi:glyoxylate reductase
VKPKVLVGAPLVGDHVNELASIADVDQVEQESGLEREELLRRVADKEGLLSLLTYRIDAELLAAAPKLRVVANHAVGFDNVDLEACRARGVVVTNTPGVLTEATADLAFGLILDASRRISEGDRMVRIHGFPRWSAHLLLGRRAFGSVLGIVGLGRIGQAVARRARGFGMRVLYTSPRRAHPDVERALAATYLDLDALLAQADIVTLHARLDESTRGLLSRERLMSMKRGAILVNTARGPLVNEHALAELLQNGHLGGAGLDVYQDEPAIDDLLFDCENAVLAPHIGSADRDTRDAMARLACEGLRDVLLGRAPAHRVA